VLGFPRHPGQAPYFCPLTRQDSKVPKGKQGGRTKKPGPAWTRRRRLIWLASYAALAFVIFGLSWLRFPNAVGGCVDFVERPFYRLMSRETSSLSPHLGIIHISDFPADDEKRQAWRPRFATVLDALVKAGASVVAFDIAFNADSIHDDELVHAIGRASPTKVVLACEGQSARCSIAPHFAPVLDSVLIGSSNTRADAAGDSLPHLPQSLRLAWLTPGPPPSSQPTFPLQVRLAFELRQNPSVRMLGDFEGRRLELRGVEGGAELIPIDVVHAERQPAMEFAATFPYRRVLSDQLDQVSTSFNEVESWIKNGLSKNLEKYRDGVVLVGADAAEDRYTIGKNLHGDDDVVYGYAVNAGMISALLSKDYPRRISIAGQIVLLYLLAVLAALMRDWIPKGEKTVTVPFVGLHLAVPLTLLALVALYVVVAIYGTTAYSVVFDPAYQVLAMVAGYYLVRLFAAGQHVAAPAATT